VFQPLDRFRFPTNRFNRIEAYNVFLAFRICCHCQVASLLIAFFWAAFGLATSNGRGPQALLPRQGSGPWGGAHPPPSPGASPSSLIIQPSYFTVSPPPDPRQLGHCSQMYSPSALPWPWNCDCGGRSAVVLLP
jgi:hypothetical protein